MKSRNAILQYNPLFAKMVNPVSPGDPEIIRFVDKALSWKSNKSQGSQEEVMMAHSHALALILGALRTLSN